MEAGTMDPPTGLDPDKDFEEPVRAGEEPEADEQHVELELRAPNELDDEVGGYAPTDSTIVFQGGEVKLPGGSFRKGERVAVILDAVVTEVSFRDRTDSKTRQVVACTRAHKARVQGINLAESAD